MADRWLCEAKTPWIDYIWTVKRLSAESQLALRSHERGSMRFKNMGALATLVVGVGFSGFMATGCGDLGVGPTLQTPDSVSTPGFDDPNNNIVPIEESRFEPEGLPR